MRIHRVSERRGVLKSLNQAPNEPDTNKSKKETASSELSEDGVDTVFLRRRCDAPLLFKLSPVVFALIHIIIWACSGTVPLRTSYDARTTSATSHYLVPTLMIDVGIQQ
ncbi:hypothetical protein NLI96_g5346 [Meripilus lineatus]|uniref:Uncharacterized protein n=1 Tax=Meripilus lineatus TaxID=2056292 RepID=A0AAD5YJ83_9APHY|nr:hypothetical protein NLI96_g5346 [Physisporinus lineatus]